MLIGLNKEQKEAAIFNMVYLKDNFAEIHHLDEPDFRVRCVESEHFFGVEITEFYLSESNARVKNIPGYATDLLKEEKYRHKVDRELLKVKDVTIKSTNGSERQSKVILQKVPKPEDYVEKIARTIKRKNERVKSYSRELSYVNLIIYDNERGLFGVTAQSVYEYFFTEEMTTALISSNFREIFLITMIERNRKVYIPLKMMFILSEIHLFTYIFDECYPELEISSKEFLGYFAEYLYTKGIEGISFKGENEEFEMIYGIYGILVSEESGISIRNYDGNGLPKDCSLYVERSQDKLITRDFIKRAKEYFTDNTFVIELAKDIRTYSG